MSNIHPTAIIDSHAQIHPSSKISPFTIIKGKVKINRNCIIGSHVTIGADPATDIVEKLDTTIFIDEGCQINDGSIIQSGCVSPTKIGKNTKINYNSLIGHGVVIGKNCFIGLNNSISGISEIGDNVISGPGCTFNNKSIVGKNVRIGIGSLILHKIEDNSVIIGRPARDIKLEKKFNSKIRKLVNDNRKSKPITVKFQRFKLLRKLLKPVYLILPHNVKMCFWKVINIFNHRS
jgi:UDP-3-O-[3-hydroxymyristoyl] glucosamine N-acyltransferase